MCKCTEGDSCQCLVWRLSGPLPHRAFQRCIVLNLWNILNTCTACVSMVRAVIKLLMLMDVTTQSLQVTNGQLIMLHLTKFLCLTEKLVSKIAAVQSGQIVPLSSSVGRPSDSQLNGHTFKPWHGYWETWSTCSLRGKLERKTFNQEPSL